MAGRSAPKTVGKTNRNIAYEEIFTAYGVEFEYVRELPLADITRHPESQIRLQAANPTRVMQYVTKIKAGSEPPPFTVYEDGFEGYRVTDANHRVAAFLHPSVDRAFAPAYVLRGISEEMSRWIGAALNGLSGLPLSSGEIEVGIKTGLGLDLKPETIARAIGASPSKVNRIIRINKFNARADALGLLTDGIVDTLRDKFSSIDDDSVFKAAVELQRDAEMSTAEWTAKDTGVLNLLKQATGEKDRLRVLQDARDARESSIIAVSVGKVSRPSPVVECQNAIIRFEKARLSYPSAMDWVPTGTLAESWAARIVSVRDFLTHVITQYEEIAGS